MFLFIFFRIKVEGLQNVPRTGRAIVCANHRSLLDPILICCFIKRKVHYMAKAELFRIPLVGWVIKKVGAFPINRSKVDTHSIKNALDLLDKESLVGMFPEGTRVKKGKSVKAKPGAALLALKSNATIIPVAIVGNYKLFSKIRIIVGEPFNINASINSKPSTLELRELSERIMEKINDLIRNA